MHPHYRSTPGILIVPNISDHPVDFGVSRCFPGPRGAAAAGTGPPGAGAVGGRGGGPTTGPRPRPPRRRHPHRPRRRGRPLGTRPEPRHRAPGMTLGARTSLGSTREAVQKRVILLTIVSVFFCFSMQSIAFLEHNRNHITKFFGPLFSGSPGTPPPRRGDTPDPPPLGGSRPDPPGPKKKPVPVGHP